MDEAAAFLKTSGGALRNLVLRGRLTPIRPGAHPLRFHRADLMDLQVDRLTKAEWAEIAATYAQVDAVLAGQALFM